MGVGRGCDDRVRRNGATCSKESEALAIEHVVIIVKENHTFDNYFGTFPGANGVEIGEAENPPPDDPNHRHEAWMTRANDLAHRVQYIADDIPGYFDLARRY